MHSVSDPSNVYSFSGVLDKTPVFTGSLDIKYVPVFLKKAKRF